MNDKFLDIKSDVYNVLSDIMMKTGATKEEMDIAIEWFQLHFYEELDEDE